MRKSKKRHVGLFTNVYKPSNNGVVRSVDSFRKGLTELGHNVFIFCPSAKDYTDEEAFVFRYPALELEAQKYPLTLPVSPSIDQVLPALKPDVFHANHPALLGRAAEVKASELDIPLVYTYHTRYREYAHYAPFLPEESLHTFIEEWLASFMCSCHHVIVPSQSIKDMVKNTYGADRGVTVLPTGIDTTEFGQMERKQARQALGWKQDDKILVSVGRLAKEKNFELLLEAVSQVDGYDHLYIVGEGENRDPLQDLVRDLGLTQKVTLTGLVRPDEVPLYYSAADLFVFASVTETQGLVTLEAMACGTPVVAVEATGTSDIVSSGRQGVLTEVCSEALGGAISELIINDPRRIEMGRAARKQAQGFDHLAQAEKLLAIYDEAQEAHRAGSFVIASNPERESKLKRFLDFFRL